MDLQLLSAAEFGISYYQKELTRALPELSDRQIEAFSLVVFDTIGYPSKVDSASLLWRYHDCMQEGRYESFLDYLCRKLLNTEIQALRELLPYLYDFSVRLGSPRPSSAKNSLISSLYYCRIHSAVCKALSVQLPNVTEVVEFGPGSGKLPIVLKKCAGVRKYTAIEAAQGFWLYQNILWEDWKSKVSREEGEYTDISHVQWFDYAKTGFILEYAPIAHAHHCLAEMNSNAVELLFYRLSDSWGANPGVLIAESQATQEVIQTARRHGLSHVHLIREGAPNAWKDNSGRIGYGINLFFKNLDVSPESMQYIVNYILTGDSESVMKGGEIPKELLSSPIFMAETLGETWLKKIHSLIL